MFFFGEDGVVGLEAVFGEGGFIAAGNYFSKLRMTWPARMRAGCGAMAYPLPWISVRQGYQLGSRCSGVAMGKYPGEDSRDKGGRIGLRKPWLLCGPLHWAITRAVVDQNVRYSILRSKSGMASQTAISGLASSARD